MASKLAVPTCFLRVSLHFETLALISLGGKTSNSLTFNLRLTLQENSGKPWLLYQTTEDEEQHPTTPDALIPEKTMQPQIRTLGSCEQLVLADRQGNSPK